MINPYKTNGLFQKTIHLMVFGPPGFTSPGLLGTIQPQLGRELQQVRLFGGTPLNVFPDIPEIHFESVVESITHVNISYDKLYNTYIYNIYIESR